MNLQEKSLAVEEVFNELDTEISKYLAKSELNCFAGCGRCCMNPKVAATVLECLPAAFEIYNSGKADEVMDRLEDIKELETCILFKKTAIDADSGYCGDYINRGLICRLFGMSARKDKYGQKQMITCKKIKEGKEKSFLSTTKKINDGMEVPLANEHYAKLSSIDFKLSNQEYPINEAIRNALELVMMYSFYYENQE